MHDFVGPLGKATEIEGLKNVCVEMCIRDRRYIGITQTDKDNLYNMIQF